MAAILNLLGKLMFLNKDSLKQEIQEDYYCLMATLFFPWNFNIQLNPDNISWKQFFRDNQHHLPPRLSRYINNLDLLHKTREETPIDYLLHRSQETLQSRPLLRPLTNSMQATIHIRLLSIKLSPLS